MAKQKSSEDLRYNGLTVPKFEEGDSAKFWLEKFNKAGTLKKWNDDEKCIHFCFALRNHVEDWYSSLTEGVKNNFESLLEKFLGRFEKGADRVFSYSEFIELTQGSDSVDCYVEMVLKCCGRKLKKSDSALMDKIVHGLNKDVKNFVVMKEAKNLEEVIKYARLGQSLTSVETSTVCDVPRRPSYGVYISQLIRFARVCSHVDDFNTRNKCLTAKLIKQGYRYHKLRKVFSKFYRRHYELISKFNVGVKSLLHQGLSEPEFYSDLVQFKKMTDFSDQFRKNYNTLQTYWL